MAPDTGRETVERLARQCDVLRDGLVGSVAGPTADVLRALLAEREALRQALVKVRAHTSYTYPDKDLLVGLLESIERIVDTALEPQP
jgi:hypothetical protein